jgi:hypothetical protein
VDSGDNPKNSLVGFRGGELIPRDGPPFPQPVPAMLRKLSREVSDCYAQADDCAHKAREAVTEQSRNDYLRAQQRWLTLAHSYEFAERLLDFSNENKRRRAEFYGDNVANKCLPLAREPTEPLQKQPRRRIKTPERHAVVTEAIEVPE